MRSTLYVLVGVVGVLQAAMSVCASGAVGDAPSRQPAGASATGERYFGAKWFPEPLVGPMLDNVTEARVRYFLSELSEQPAPRGMDLSNQSQEAIADIN